MTSSDLSGDFDSLSAPRKFTGIWIPREIYLRKDINALEKMLWAEIYSLHSDEHGGCYASEKYLTEFIGIKRTQLYEMLKHLKELGLLEDVKSNGRQIFRKAIVSKPFKDEAGQQTSGKPDITRPENRTHTNIYNSKVYNKDIESTMSANAGTSSENSPEKIFVSSDLATEDIKKGTLKIPQKKWDEFVTQFGEARVVQCATELSNYIVNHPRKYKKPYLALATFIKNSLQREEEKKIKSKSKRDYRHFDSNGKYPKEYEEILC